MNDEEQWDPEDFLQREVREKAPIASMPELAYMMAQVWLVLRRLKETGGDPGVFEEAMDIFVAELQARDLEFGGGRFAKLVEVMLEGTDEPEPDA